MRGERLAHRPAAGVRRDQSRAIGLGGGHLGRDRVFGGRGFEVFQLELHLIQDLLIDELAPAFGTAAVPVAPAKQHGRFTATLVGRGRKSPKPAQEALVIAPPDTTTIVPQAASSPTAAVPAPPPTIGRMRASPAARRLARSCKVNLAAVAGSGPGGAIIFKDIERQLTAATMTVEKKFPKGLDLDAMRVTIAAAMARSKREIPHYYLEHQVDVTPCEAWLARMNATRPPESRLLMGAVAMKAVALAVRRFPTFNGFYVNGKFEPSSGVHPGMAIAIRGGGLAAPAIHDADRLSCDALMASMRDLVARMRSGRIRSSEIADATVTISSLGERGVDALYGVIYPPQVAIVGFGKVVARPWIVDDAVLPRSIVSITLSGDHRVSDGHGGALFLAEIGKLLQEPDKL